MSQVAIVFIGICFLGSFSGCLSQACIQYNIPSHDLNTGAGSWINVFLDLAIQCSEAQEVQAWQFYARQAGVVIAAIWRLSDDESTLTLIGANRIEVAQEGLGLYEVESGSRYMVEPGDVIGIHYDMDAYTNGVIPYEQSPGTLCCGLQASDLSRIYNVPSYPLSAGDVINNVLSGVPSHRRFPALVPVLGLPSSQAECAARFTRVGSGCYMVDLQTQRTHEDNREFCGQHGATLASFDDNEEFESVTSWLEDIGSPAVWIGLHSDEAGQWYWEDGSLFTQDSWWGVTLTGRQQPDGGDENAGLIHAASGYLIHDQVDTWEDYALCQIAG